MCLTNCKKLNYEGEITVYKVVKVEKGLTHFKLSSNPFISKDTWAFVKLPPEETTWYYQSVYNPFPWEFNEIKIADYTLDYSSFMEEEKEIGKGFFHSFKDKESAIAEYYDIKSWDTTSNLAIGEFTIPEDSVVYTGDYNGLEGLASNKLIFKGIIWK